MSPDRFLSIAQVADKLGLDRSHTYALIREGRFPVPVVKTLGHMKVSERELERWMADAGQLPAAPVPQVSAPRRRRRQGPPSPAGEVELRMPIP